MTTHAVVLAGGAARRLGGVDKPGLLVGGRTLLDIALAAVADCTEVVVVGPHRPGLASSIRQTRENPAGSGPVAALAAGLAALPSGSLWTLVVAADLPHITPATIAELGGHLGRADTDAVFATDATGRPQYLCAAWRTAALAARLAELDSPIGGRVRDLVPARHTTLSLTGVEDCDTPAALRAARRRFDRRPDPRVDER